jgi:hypothetical protein
LQTAFAAADVTSVRRNGNMSRRTVLEKMNRVRLDLEQQVRPEFMHETIRDLDEAIRIVDDLLVELGEPRTVVGPPWFADPAFLKRELERIATHSECPKAIYNIAADALCWARKHEPTDVQSEGQEK